MSVRVAKLLAQLTWVLSLAVIGLGELCAAPPDFIETTGSEFSLNGSPVRLKGSNYYPKNHMWADMWNSWDWPEIQVEADMMAAFGLNCVRILVPYSNGGWNGPNVPPDRLQKLEDIVNLFGQKGIRSCITLFDWETSFPAAGTSKETDHKTYINHIVGRLKNNRFVFMWDVKNEPDHPANIGGMDNWDINPAKRDQIVGWLERMCNYVRSVDPNHPCSVGLRWYENFSDVAGFVDVAIYHSYWSGLALTEINTVKAAMGSNLKPILVQEFGWPTNPTPCNRDGQLIYDYTETRQLQFFQTYLPLFEQHGVAGCIQWMTFDAKNYTSNQNESFENYFGLWKYDYTLKPGAIYYRDNFVVSPIPYSSDTTPPAPVSSFNAIPGDTRITLSWVNPSDADFTNSVIRMKTSGFPANVNDGTLVANRQTPPGASDQVTFTGLTNGTTYYYAIYAQDNSLNYSTASYASSTPQRVYVQTTTGDCKTLADLTYVTLSNVVVTAVFSTDGAVYVQQQDRSAGVRVAGTLPALAVGDIVNVTGQLNTRKLNNLACERVVQGASVNKIAAGDPPVALSMNTRNVGGGSAGVNAPGVKGSNGVYCIGMLLKVTGQVTQIASPYFYVDDGAGVDNMLGLDTPVKGVMVRHNYTSDLSVGDFVSVTGISEGSLPVGWTENRPFLRTRSQVDVVRIAQ